MPFGIPWRVMKELNAVDICVRLKAALLANDIPLQVHSVFPNAINIICKDVFLTLLSSTRCLFPMSCRVSGKLRLTDYGIREGMEVITSGDSIFITKADISINMKNSIERDLSFDNITGLLVPEDLFLKVRILKELIGGKGCEYDLSTLVTGKYHNPYADLVMKKLPGFHEAIKKNKLQAEELAGEIAGCGMGLTPSSDDMLIGYMAAYLADSRAKGRSIEEIYMVTNAIGKKASVHTNTISGAFLRQCGTGLLSEDMTKLLCTVYSDSKATLVKKYANRILDFGSTSGTDMLTGVVLAIVNFNGGDYFG